MVSILPSSRDRQEDFARPDSLFVSDARLRGGGGFKGEEGAFEFHRRAIFAVMMFSGRCSSSRIASANGSAVLPAETVGEAWAQ